MGSSNEQQTTAGGGAPHGNDVVSTTDTAQLAAEQCQNLSDCSGSVRASFEILKHAHEQLIESLAQCEAMLRQATECLALCEENMKSFEATISIQAQRCAAAAHENPGHHA